MKKNVGTVDALIRITLGLTGLAWGTARMVRFPMQGVPMLVTMMAAMRVAEGVTRFCPMIALFQRNQPLQMMDTTQKQGETQTKQNVGGEHNNRYADRQENVTYSDMKQ